MSVRLNILSFLEEYMIIIFKDHLFTLLCVCVCVCEQHNLQI